MRRDSHFQFCGLRAPKRIDRIPKAELSRNYLIERPQAMGAQGADLVHAGHIPAAKQTRTAAAPARPSLDTKEGPRTAM